MSDTACIIVAVGTVACIVLVVVRLTRPDARRR